MSIVVVGSVALDTVYTPRGSAEDALGGSASYFALAARHFTDALSQAGTDTSRRELTVPFDFDSDYLTLHATRIISEAARVAKAIKAARVEVTGYRATTWLSNGTKFIEAESIAAKRANKVGEILVGLGLSAATVSVTAKTEAEPCDGVTDAEKRRVIISLKL